MKTSFIALIGIGLGIALGAASIYVTGLLLAVVIDWTTAPMTRPKDPAVLRLVESIELGNDWELNVVSHQTKWDFVEHKQSHIRIVPDSPDQITCKQIDGNLYLPLKLELAWNDHYYVIDKARILIRRLKLKDIENTPRPVEK